MSPLPLKEQLNEHAIVSTLVAVNKIRKISKEQLHDIFTTSPNYIAVLVEKTNEFLTKIAYAISMAKLETLCENIKFVDTHPQEYQAVQTYFGEDGVNSQSYDDAVDLGCMYDAIGKFCISTEKFFKELQGTPGDTQAELIHNILQTIDKEMDEYQEDKVATARYAHWFFRKLLEKNAKCLPKGIKADDVLRYIKMYIYDDERE